MNKDYLISSFKSINIELTEEKVEQFNNYYNLIIDWNNKINLTAITEYEEVVIKHFIDSVLICKVFDLHCVSSLIDIGTGAGFPGIPLKIVYPHLNITLLDSLNKRCDFLKTVCKDLYFDDLTYNIVHGRAEDFGKSDDYREKYDLCVSRAVSRLNILSEYCIPFVRKDGYFIPYKADKGIEEAEEAKKAINILGADINKIDNINIPNTDYSRCFIIISKKDFTPIKYPRKAGTPEKKPIK